MNDNKVVLRALINNELFDYIISQLGNERKAVLEMTNYIDADIEEIRNALDESHTDVLVADMELYADENGQKKLEAFYVRGALNHTTATMTRVYLIYKSKNIEEFSKTQRELQDREIPVYPLKLNGMNIDIEMRVLAANVSGAIIGAYNDIIRKIRKKERADEIIKRISDAIDKG